MKRVGFYKETCVNSGVSRLSFHTILNERFKREVACGKMSVKKKATAKETGRRETQQNCVPERGW